MYDPLGVVDVADDACDARVLVLQWEWRRPQGTLVDVLWATKKKIILLFTKYQHIMHSSTTYMESIEVGCVL